MRTALEVWVRAREADWDRRGSGQEMPRCAQQTMLTVQMAVGALSEMEFERRRAAGVLPPVRLP